MFPGHLGCCLFVVLFAAKEHCNCDRPVLVILLHFGLFWSYSQVCFIEDRKEM